MRLNKTTDYAIRSIIYLAKQNSTCTSLEISEKMGIPQKYLNKIIRQLRVAGFIKSYQGINGGYALNKAANEISLLDIIEEMDGEFFDDTSLLQDMELENNSTINVGPVRECFAQVFHQLRTRLANTKISDVIDKEDSIL